MRLQKSLAETVSEGMTTFTATVSARMNTMHNELTELQDVVVQLTAELSEMHSLLDTVQQMSTQLAELRNAATQNQQNEVRDLHAALHLLSVQQSETRELRDAMNLMSTQVSSLSLAIGSHSGQPNQQSSLKYRTNKPTELNELREATKQTAATQLSVKVGSDSTSRQPPSSSSQFGEVDFPSLSLQNQSQSRISQPPARATAGSAPTRQPPQSAREQQKDFMAAMYVDLKSKQRRANNIIITGLQQQSGISDAAAVCKLLHDEFGWDTSELEDEMTSCRRVGRVQQDRIQPLLVIFNSTESAAYFVTNAKKLRRSRNSAVRDNVYISQDLTPSEAKAAYEMRLHRRQQQNRWENQSPMQQQGQSAVVSRLVYRSRLPAADTKSPATDLAQSENPSRRVDQSTMSSPSTSSAAVIASETPATHTNTQSLTMQGDKPTDAAQQSTAGRPR